MRSTMFAAAIVATIPVAAFAQGLVGGAERGARQGEIEAGPIGGAVGAAVGTVNGALGINPRGGCKTVTTRRTDGAGDTEVTKRTNCP